MARDYKYELHVYSANLSPETIYHEDLKEAIKEARQWFKMEHIYKVKIWNLGKAVPNRKTEDLLFELV